MGHYVFNCDIVVSMVNNEAEARKILKDELDLYLCDIKSIKLATDPKKK